MPTLKKTDVSAVWLMNNVNVMLLSRVHLGPGYARLNYFIACLLTQHFLNSDFLKMGVVTINIEIVSTKIAMNYS